MPRLVSADLYPGRNLKIDGARHRVIGLKDRGTSVILQRDDATDTESGSLCVIARAELLAQIVEERARLLDDIEDPDIAEKQPEINLSVLSLDRKIDWYHKMILLRGLLTYAKLSPRSAQFKIACKSAQRLLTWVKENQSVGNVKSWSDKTLNDDLRRWRRAGYAFAAFQVKGLQHRPIKNKPPKYVTARTLIDQIRKENPLWSIQTVRRLCQQLLRNGITSYAGDTGKAGAHTKTAATTAVE